MPPQIDRTDGIGVQAHLLSDPLRGGSVTDPVGSSARGFFFACRAVTSERVGNAVSRCAGTAGLAVLLAGSGNGGIEGPLTAELGGLGVTP
jgi:hypothetical protein